MAKQRIIPIVYKVDYSQVDKSTASVKKAEQATDKLNKEIKETGDAGMKSFGALKNAIIATGIVGIVGTLAKKIFDVGVAQEQTNIAFTTFLGSAQKAKVLIAELTKFSIVTPFSPEQVNKAAKTLLAFGVEAKNVIPTLKLLGDVASGTGKDLGEMAVIFGQIRSTGRLMGQDLLQLINAGFNPLQVISQKTGKSVGDLKKEMEKGLITFDMVEQAFKDATSSGGLFFNLMEKQSQSIGGLMSTIGGNIEEGFKNIFTQGSGPLKDFVDQLVKLSEAFMIFTKGTEQLRDEEMTKVIVDNTKEFEKYIEVFGDADKALEFHQRVIDNRLRSLKEEWKIQRDLSDQSVSIQDMALGNAQAKQQEIDFAKKLTAVLSAQIDAYELKLIPALKEYILTRDLATESDKKAAFKTPKDIVEGEPEDITDEIEKIVDAEEKKAEAREKYYTDALKMLDDYGKEFDQQQKEIYDREYEKAKEQADKLLELEKEKQRNKRDLQEAAFEFGVDAIGGLLLASTDSFAAENEALQSKYDEQIRLAGDNENAKKQIEIKRAEEEKKLRSKQVEDEKKQNTRRILIETVLNAVKALGLPPIPGANYIAAAKATAYGLLGAGLARMYSKGSEVGIDGPGTTTSDSIPAMLSRNETVMSSNETNASRGILKAIKAKKLDDSKLERLYHKKTGGDGGAFSDKRIVEAIKGQKQPDYTKIGSYIYEVKSKNRDHKSFVRKKYISG